MKVLIVVRPAAGGIRRHVEQIASALHGSAAELGVAAPEEMALALPAGVRRSHVPIAPRPSPGMDSRSIALLRGLFSGYDLVHAQGMRAAWLVGSAARQGGCRFVWTAHNLPPRSGPFTRWLFRRGVRDGRLVVCVSEAVRAAMLPWLPGGSAVSVVRGGVDLRLFSPAGDKDFVRQRLGLPQGPLLLGIGRFSREKGFDRLVRAMPEVLARVPAATLLLAGEGPERAALERLAAAAAPSDRIRFLGRVEDVATLLRAVNVVCVPSRSEGLGLAAIESMAAGVPVVATAVGGLTEVVEDGVTGHLAAPDDMAARIADLLVNEEQARAMGAAARARAEALFSLERMAAETAEVWREVLSMP